jgi:hypothetical protein
MGEVKNIGEVKRYEYINFSKVIPVKPRKTGIWICRNNKSGDALGIVQWCTSWRQYCWFPESDTQFSKGCLEDIIDFIKHCT